MDFKKLTPHLIAIAAILLVAMVFFAPNAFDGKVLPQSDNNQARGMQTEIFHYQDKDGKLPLWTNSAFGGMPAFQIYSQVKGNLTAPLWRAMLLWTDHTSVWAQVFAAMLCMYLLMFVLGADWRVAIFGAVAFGVTTYNIDILEAGHSTKMSALALAPGVLASAVMIFNDRRWHGGGLMAIFIGMQLYANHMQITYYTLILTGIFILAQLADAVRHKAWISWGRATAIIGIAIILGAACNVSRLWPTYEYGQETIRGKSELSGKASQGGGLSKEYLFGWSVGIAESLTLIVPHAYGGGSNESIQEGKFFEMESKGASPKEKEQLGRQIAGALYCGDQPFVGTAIYFGAIVCFLFFLGAFLVQGPVKWWLLIGGLFSVSLAWGKYFFFNDLLYQYFPMFNKFRAVSMALGPGQLCFAALAALGLQKMFDADIDVQRKQRAIYVGVGITAVLCLMAMVFGGGHGANDEKLAEQIKLPDLPQILLEDRASMARSDAFRSLGFILVAAGLLWFAVKGQLKAGLAVILVSVVALADHWMICNRSLSADRYETKRAVVTPPKEEDFDKQIKQDKDLDYRVLDLARGSLASNAMTSYYHKSLSGYHAAKLQLYQEVIDTFFSADLARNLHIAGMLNAKYIVTQKGDVIPNIKACGNAWFVKDFKVVPTSEAEIGALHQLDPKQSAVVLQANATALNGLTIQPDSTNSIRMTKYHPDKMEYEYSAKTEQLALFSEMYYPPAKGWKCYINGQPAPDFIKADYFIRGMRLPAGQNMKLEMRFEPKSYYLGETISYIGSVITLLLFAAGLFFWYRNRQPENPNRLSKIERAAEERPVKTAAAPARKKK
jgi:hypothetical protein